MKRTRYVLLTLLAVLMSVVAKGQERNVLRVPDVTVQIGQVQLPVAIENTDEIVAAQFDLTLPTGLTAGTEAVTTNRCDGHTVIIRNMGATRYRVMLYSDANRPLLGQQGTVLNIPLTVPQNFVEGSELQLTISNATLSVASGANVLTEATAGKLTISKLPDLTVKNIVAVGGDLTIIPGEHLSVSWQVENVGGLATGAGWSEQIMMVNKRGTYTKLIGTVYYQEPLEAGGVVSRQADLQVPVLLGIEGEAYLQVRIVTNKETGESTSAAGNNMLQAAEVFTVEKKLLVEPSLMRLVEGTTSRVNIKVSCSGDWGGEQTFSLSATNDSRISLPAQVTIPVGQSAASVYMTVANNTVLDNDSIVIITATGNGYPEATARLVIEDNEYPDLQLTSSKSVVTEGETFQLTVTTTRISEQPIVVTLTSETAKRFSFPQTVTIPAGETLATVDVLAIDDEVPSLELSNAFTVSAPKYNKAEVIVILNDNDLPVLELELTPTTVSESAGPIAVAGVLRRTTKTNSKITVKLSDDANGGLYFGNCTLELAKGVEEVHFNFGPVDNATVDGDRTYTITAAVWISSCSCGASGESAGYVTAQLNVLDNDGPALNLTSSLSTMKEGGKTILTVSRNTTDTSTPLTVTLNSDYEDGLTYEHTVTIPAGQQSTTVEVTSAANSEQGDSHTVIFTVQAEGYSKGTCFVMVTDQTLPDARISSITAEATEAEVGAQVKLTIEVTNDGAAELPAEVAVKVYHRGESAAIATLYTPNALAIGESLQVSRTIILPTNVGNHSYYAVVNESSKVNELSFTNNTSVDAIVKVIAPFSVTVTTDKKVYQQNEKILINGQLTGNGTANAEVDLYVINEGARQVQKVTTDAQGTFSYEWELYNLQSGHFIVGACYPNEGLKSELASFDVYGLRRTNYNNITCETLVGEAYHGNIQLSNPGQLNLNNVHAVIKEKPEHITATFTTLDKMEGGSTKAISFTLNSDELSPSNNWELIKVSIMSNEGPTVDAIIYYHNSSPRASLTTNISGINTTMSMDESCDYAFYITNKGKGLTGSITLGLPSWMKSATTSVISSLDYGESTQVVLRLIPSEDMQLNVPLTGHISINCENGNGITLPYSIKPVSERTGTMVVDVTDEYTFLTEEKPHVENAHVVVRQPVSGEKVAEGNTDAKGLFIIELPAGYYNVNVTADRHDSYSNSIMVTPGTETPVDVFLSFQAITYSWDVVETEVEDEYEIVTTVNYETRAPKPVVVVNYPEELPYQTQIVNILVTNKGLVSAYNVDFDANLEREGATFEPLVSLPIDTLLPQTSIAIPVLMTVEGDDVYESQGSVDHGGTYYGDGDADVDQGTSPMQAKRRADDIEEISPGCWRLTFTVPHDRRECNKQTGKWETVGREYTSHTWLYGNCGGTGGTGGTGGGIWLPSWIPTWTPGHSDPNPPYNPPTHQTRQDEDDNNQRTQIFDGCTTDCTDAAINAAVGCALAAGGCAASGGLASAFTCVGGLAVGCHNVHDVSSSVDCILAGLGCIPGPVGCAFGTVGCAKSIYDEYNACVSRRSARVINRRRTKSISKENYDALLTVQKVDSLTIEKIYVVLGEGDWENVTGAEFEIIQDYLWKNMTDDDVLLTEDRFQYKPLHLPESDFDRFLIRISNSLQKSKNSDRSFDNVIDEDLLKSLDNELASLESEAQEMGYNDIRELSDSVASHYSYLLRRAEESGNNSVCATITLQFKQTMTMTRQAFRGTLKVFNGHPLESMTDVKLNLEVKDPDGNVATAHEFQINAESLEGFGGRIALDAGWTLAGNTDGTATVLFIPTKYAAPTEPVEWSFGGTLTYVDPFSGLEVTRTLAPVTLTVKPSPELDLTYFMQRDVYGDDPLTLDVVEPMEPAEFALLINNKGNGDATNVRMVTQQPEIIDNEKGLHIDFEIVSSQVNGADAALAFGKSIANDFGTIPAHSQMYAQWWLTSTLLGHFTDYKVEATHVTSYGNEDLSLLDQVTIHELIHSLEVSADGNKLRGFMVNDITDAEDLPDMLYLTNGEVKRVAIVTSANGVKTSATEYRLTVVPSSDGWNYGSFMDPAHGLSTIKSVVRQSDGKEMPLQNFWQTDRTLRDGKDWLYENRIHFADEFATQSSETYILTFEPTPAILLDVASIEGIPEEGNIAVAPVENITVNFTKKVNPETFTTEDLTLAVQGVKQDVSGIGIFSEDNKAFTLDMSACSELSNGYYTLTVQTADITDEEGFQGKSGKQVGWILFRGGLVQLLLKAYPENSGTVMRKPVESADARRHAPAAGGDNSAEYGSTVVLFAEPKEGYEFSNWTLNGIVVSNEPEYTTTALSDMDVVANFTKKRYRVEIGVDGDGGSTQGTATGIYEYGTEINVSAKPDEDYMFKGWTVDGEQVEGNAPTITALVKKPLGIKASFMQEYYRHSMTFARGWNWMSSYLNEPLALDVMANYVNRIVGQFDEIVNDPEYGLVGNMTEMTAGKAYKVEANTRFTNSFRGHLYDMDQKPISLHQGWNWIGYPCKENLAINSAIQNAEEGDYLVSQTGFAEFADGIWEGTLDALEPGAGYLYKSESDKNLTLAPVSNSSESRPMKVQSAAAVAENVDIHRYPNTMNVTAKLFIDGAAQTDEDYHLYAMVGDELRGIGQYVGTNYYLTVYGDEPVDIAFVIESAKTGNTYVANEVLAFRDDVIGSRRQPYVIAINGTTGISQMEDSDKPMTVYSLEGVLVSRDATIKTLRKLPKGVYIVNGRKCYVK